MVGLLFSFPQRALYRQTKDIYYFKEFLGHKSVLNTEIYITVEHTLFTSNPNDSYIVKIAETLDDVKALLEVGFEWVGQKDNVVILRKRQ